MNSRNGRVSRSVARLARRADVYPRRAALRALVGLFCVALVGCAATCPPPPAPEVHTRVIDSACDWTHPIYPSSADVLSDATAAAILSHDEAGAKNCRWTPLR